MNTHNFMKRYCLKRMVKLTKTLEFSKKNILLFPFFAVLSFFSGIIFIACDEKPNQLGNDIFPSSDYFHIRFDSSALLIMDTSTVDFLITRQPVYNQYIGSYNYNDYLPKDSSNLIGSYSDDVFGQSSSGFLIPFGIYSADIKRVFGQGLHPVSMTLYLKRDSVLIGSATELQDYEVFEIKRDLTDSVYLNYHLPYYSNTNLTNYLGDKVGEGTFAPNADSIGFKITDNDLMNRLLSADTTQMKGGSAFHALFKGLYLKSKSKNSNKGAIFSVNVLHYKSKLELKYRTNENVDTSINYPISYSFGGISVFQHDYTASEVKNNPKYIYVEGMAGSHGLIKLADIGRWKDSIPNAIVINRAELILTPDTSYLNSKNINKNLYPQYLNLYFKTDSTDQYLSDKFIGTQYFNGILNRNTNQYSFHITNYIQRLIKQNGFEKKPQILALRAGNGAHSVQRIAFDKATCVRLRITYSIIKK